MTASEMFHQHVEAACGLSVKTLFKTSVGLDVLLILRAGGNPPRVV
jgi:hypothetical protein